MCTGRVDLSFILRALAKGADGVIIGGCWPGECHYVTEGNYDALANLHLCRKLLVHLGLSPERLRVEWIAASEGSRFAEVMNDFVKKQKELGPLGEGEGIDRDALQNKLAAAQQLVPYIRLVERERLRCPTRSEEAYTAFYESDEVNQLFDELIVSRLTTSQIMLMLRDRARSTGELADRLGLTPAVVSRQLSASSRQGLVTFADGCWSNAVRAG